MRRPFVGVVLAAATIEGLTFLAMPPAQASQALRTTAERQPIDSVPGEVLSGSRLARFLGPVSPNLFTWSKSWEPENVVYCGTTKPPLSGRVIIMIFLGPRRFSHMPTPGGPDRVGVLSGHWRRWKSADIHAAEFGFADADHNWVMININSPLQNDAETIAAEVSRLPIFNSTPQTPFRGLLVRRRILRIVCWVLVPSAFAATVWLADRYVRRKRYSSLLRTIAVAAMSALWLGLFIASIRFSPLGFKGALFWYNTGAAHLFWIVGVAALCFLGAVFVAIGMMLSRVLAVLSRLLMSRA